MVKLLIWLIIAALVVTGAVFYKKMANKKKVYIVVIGSLLASALALWLQTNNPLHISLLALLGLSLVAALIFMKVTEREEQAKAQLQQERVARKKQSQMVTNTDSEKAEKAERVVGTEKAEMAEKQYEEKTENKSEKALGMEHISPIGKGN